MVPPKLGDAPKAEGERQKLVEAARGRREAREKEHPAKL